MLREIVAQSILDAMDQLREHRSRHQASNPAGPLRSLLQRL